MTKSSSVTNKSNKIKSYTKGEEIANALTHGLGSLAAIIVAPILIAQSLGTPLLCDFSAHVDLSAQTVAARASGTATVAASIYVLSLALEFAFSALYHALTNERAKRIFKVIDHSGIYILIAGTYTPFAMIVLQGNSGGLLLALVWGLTIIGISAEAFWTFRPKWVSVVIYLLMGWCVVWFMPQMLACFDPHGMTLLIIGGICYTIGCVFYVLK